MKPEMPNLPEEIIYDILSRLPVVSLCRFRCVSKSWRSLISHPRFVRAHLNGNNNNNKYERLILSKDHDDPGLYSVELDSSEFGPQSVAVHLNFAQHQNPTSCGQEFWGSCDGLVLMVLDGFLCRLVNPTTREYRELPESPFKVFLRGELCFNYGPCYDSSRDGLRFKYGLGYDSSIDDYKVVSICYSCGEVESSDNEVSVYALKTNSWRRIGKSPHDHQRFGLTKPNSTHSGAFVCGALHWLATNGIYDPIAFDVITALGLTDENFRTVPSPTLDFFGDGLSVLGGCLCVFAFRGGFHLDAFLDIWVMKEYGVRDSWMKFTVPYGDNCCTFWTPLSLSRTGQVLINAEGCKLVLFDPREEEPKKLVVRDCPSLFEVGTYVESLVSPNNNHLLSVAWDFIF